jgi:peptide/nickel transport system substrate-binding protein
MQDNRDTVNRRSFLASLGLGGAVVLAGCGSDGGDGGGDGSTPTPTDASGDGSSPTSTATEASSDADEEGTPTPTEANPENARFGGHLITSVSRKPNTLNPVQHVNGAEYQVTGWLYSNLTRVNTDLEVEPDLATDWEANDDASEWTFELRDDATFHHNGEQVAAPDVKATLETIQDPDVGSPGKGAIGPIDSVEVVDDTTARLVLSGPFADIPKKMAKQHVRILPADVANNRLDEAASNDFGSGPFQLEEFEVGDHITVSAYDDYHFTDEEGNPLPYVDQVTQRVFPETTAEISAMGNGNVDIMWETPPSQLERLKSTDGINALRTAGGAFANIVMRSDQPPFDDNRVRKAFKLAVDKQAMLEGAQNGVGVIGQDTPISPAYEFYTDLPTRERNLDRAQELLNEAGYGDGMEMELFAANQPEVRVNSAVLLKEQLAPLNVNVEIQQVSYDNYLSNVWTQAPFYVGFYGLRFTEDGILFLLLHSEGSWNEAHWSDDEFDQKLEDARRTADPDERAQLYADAQRILWERGPYLVPFFQDELAASRDYVENYQLDPTGFFVPVEDTWLGDGAPNRE